MKKGLIGYPLGHSYSNFIHEEFDNGPYDIISLHEDDFQSWMLEKKFSMINVTTPYKEKVIPFLDELSQEAQRIGAVNLVINNSGKLKGYNTDYDGFEWLLKSVNADLKGKKVVVLGGGGTSKTVSEVLRNNDVSFLVVSRKESANNISYEDLLKKHNDAEIIINTTTVGMYPCCDEAVIDLSKFKQAELVIDVIYNPSRTVLLQKATDLGIQAVGGLGMLVAQAKKAVELFSNQKISDKKVIEIISKIEDQNENIVLIGMPGSGKTTLSKQLGAALQKEVISLDDEVERISEKSIHELFNQGEKEFRKWEAEAVKRNSLKRRVIFDCGGGIVKQKEVMQLLRYHGKIIWIQRDLNLLEVSETRPLSTHVAQLENLYQERFDLYDQYADVEVENNGNLDEVVETLIELVK